MSLLEKLPVVSATEAGHRLGSILDRAATKGPVRIKRRGMGFVLVREDQYEQLANHGETLAYPDLSLEEMLASYEGNRDRSSWPDDAPRGRETI